MRKYMVLALAALSAPVLASGDKADWAHSVGRPIDMLYPEIAVGDSGWRGLLPVILYNVDKLADRPRSLPSPDKRSERNTR